MTGHRRSAIGPLGTIACLVLVSCGRTTPREETVPAGRRGAKSVQASAHEQAPSLVEVRLGRYILTIPGHLREIDVSRSDGEGRRWTSGDLGVVIEAGRHAPSCRETTRMSNYHREPAAVLSEDGELFEGILATYVQRAGDKSTSYICLALQRHDGRRVSVGVWYSNPEHGELAFAIVESLRIDVSPRSPK